MDICEAGKKRKQPQSDRRYRRRPYYKSEKQLRYEAKETNTPNFLRLLLMRLVYGIAAQMGVEERLEDAFNGAFVPPNADDDGLLDDVIDDEVGFDVDDLGL